MSDIAICSVCSLSYVPQTIVMIRSLQRFSKYYSFHIFLSDVTRKDGEKFANAYLDLTFYYIDEFSNEQVLDNAFMLTPVEFNTSLKAIAIKHIIEKYNQKTFYCDSDLFFLQDLSFAIKLLDDFDIILTPHHVESEGDCSDFGMLRNGVFNAGFIGINGKNGIKFVHWWSQKLAAYCLLEPEEGLFVDQKWLDLVPSLFESVYILRHPGYNLAYWNIRARGGVCKETVFLHLSGIDLRKALSAGGPISKYSTFKVDQQFSDILAPYFKTYEKEEKDFYKSAIPVSGWGLCFINIFQRKVMFFIGDICLDIYKLDSRTECQC